MDDVTVVRISTVRFIFFVYLLPSLLILLPDPPFNGPLSRGSYGGTHAKRRHVTGIRIADEDSGPCTMESTSNRCDTTQCIGPRKSDFYSSREIYEKVG